MLGVAWELNLHPDVAKWFLALAGSNSESDRELAKVVERTIDQLEEHGPSLGRPLADKIQHARHHGMKELRPPKVAGMTARILFGFDRKRQALLLVAGDKAGRWERWYDENIPIADERWHEWELRGEWS